LEVVRQHGKLVIVNDHEANVVPQSCALAGEKADAMIAVEPDDRLVHLFGQGGGSGKAKIRASPKAGFTHVALVQIGGDHQAPFIEWAEQELLPALRSA